MKSLTSVDFWHCYRALPPEARAAARKAYRFGRKIRGILRSVFENVEDFGAFVLAADIARWPFLFPTVIFGSELARMMNTREFYAEFNF